MAISNIYIDQGTDFSTTITINDSNGSPLDLTSYTASAQLRKTYTSSIHVDFTSTFDSDRTTGKITISMNNTLTSSLVSGIYVYDLVISDSLSEITRVLEGSVTISPSVTK
jgi:hypothetical protein